MKPQPETYPIDAYLPDISDSLRESDNILIKAETGAGKTTRLPPYVLNHISGKVLVLEPRRLAAKLSAKRCAEALQEDIGGKVGHHIRFDKTANKNTSLLFITEGLFLPYLKEDPKLSKYSVIILDEFHERSLHTDVALSLIKKLQSTTRPDLKLIVMSATLETEKLENYLEDPRVFNIPGRTYPIEIEYKKINDDQAVHEMLRDSRCPKNMLVFLPGMGAIKSLAQKLEGKIPSETEIVPLHSSLSKKKQSQAYEGDKRKIILSTNIAETSLTLPNITGVIDLGMERRASFAPWSGMPLLQLERISKASATQRAGRAGRVSPGIVYRLYSESDYYQRPSFTPPEIQRLELSHYLLDLMDLGHRIEELRWFEPPPEKHLNSALELLEQLEAIKEEKVTPRGQYLSQIPLHPRLGAMLYATSSEALSDALLGACVISEGMVLNQKAEFSPEELDDEDICDLCMQCDLIKSFHWDEKGLSDFHLSLLDRKKATRVIDLYTSLSQKVGTSPHPSKEKTSHPEIVNGLLAGFPDRVAGKREVRRKGKILRSYNFCLGRGGKVSKRSLLHGSSADFLIVLDALENPKANAATGTTIQAASKVTKEALTNSNSPYITMDKETEFDEKKGKLKITTSQKYGKLTIWSETRSADSPRGETLIQLMQEDWPWPFDDDLELKAYNQRVHLLNRAEVEHNCPLLEGEMFELFLHSIVEEETTFSELKGRGLKKLIEEQLSPQDHYILSTQTPELVKLSNGKELRVNYLESDPSVSARIQDLFSVVEHPKIASGNIPLVINLLSPANRIAQVVQDLPGFWNTSWPEVRKDLKSKYPKHFWPESPETSEPVRMVKNQKNSRANE